MERWIDDRVNEYIFKKKKLEEKKPYAKEDDQSIKNNIHQLHSMPNNNLKSISEIQKTFLPIFSEINE